MYRSCYRSLYVSCMQIFRTDLIELVCMYVGRLRSLAGWYEDSRCVCTFYGVIQRAYVAFPVCCTEKAERAAVQSDVVFVAVSG